MYDSIKEWVNIPMTIYPYIGRNGTGDKQYGDVLEILCYPVGEIKKVVNDKGVEVVSSSHIYVDGDTQISTLDSISIDGFVGINDEIIRITTYYREGRPDIKVVYL